MKVALGGTFEPLHERRDGEKRVRCVLPFQVKAENVCQLFLRKYGFESEIVMITSPLETDFDGLVVLSTCGRWKTNKEIDRYRRLI